MSSGKPTTKMVEISSVGELMLLLFRPWAARLSPLSPLLREPMWIELEEGRVALGTLDEK
jgi:hypothetical protein